MVRSARRTARAIADSAQVVLRTTRHDFRDFLDRPPELRAGHLTVTSWILDPNTSTVLLTRSRNGTWSCPERHVADDMHPDEVADKIVHDLTGRTLPVRHQPLTISNSTRCPRTPTVCDWTVGYLFTAGSSGLPLATTDPPAAWFRLAELPRPVDPDIVRVAAYLANIRRPVDIT